MKAVYLLTLSLMPVMILSCGPNKQETGTAVPEKFEYLADRFGDTKVMRYQVPGFDSLSLQQKTLVYYLSQAALCGRDILFDQNFKHNLAIRHTLEAMYAGYKGDRASEGFKAFEVYLKKVWFANGIHHHYSMDKFVPGFSREYFMEMAATMPEVTLPLMEGETRDAFLQRVGDILFDPSIAPKRVSLDDSKDLVLGSACNFYEGVTQAEVEAFYAAMKDPKDPTPISYGLNSKVVKGEDGKLRELVYKQGGMYGPAIDKIIFWLEKAVGVAENDHQRRTIEALIAHYKSGDLEAFDQFNVLWVQDLDSRVDFVNGFTEVYGDPLGMKATWEAVVNFKDIGATRRTEIISANAQWFEDNSPVDPRFKKKEVKGVSAKVITVAQLGGDCYPSTPIGINLPNADWIRKEHGSKSVTMENITYAYDQAALGSGFLEEFCSDTTEIARAEKHAFKADNLHTDLHECLGHGSGQILPGVSSEALKNYSSALEETRADLFALYYLMDPKLIELGLFDTDEVPKAEYDRYIRNGLMTQLTRIEKGKDIEQAHMRNRQLIAKWVLEKGAADKVVELFSKDGKTYARINDYQKLRTLFGQLLAEVQRIKSEGDYAAGKALVEQYGVKVDPVLHAEVLERYQKLDLAPYGGFINPTFVPVEENGKIVDVKIEYPASYTEQMLKYSKEFGLLPVYN
ncbi:MAG TPA: dihydrofolate reductase [Bacteroidales bacterium]|nr:dihydrofolate reductase [Bacteroidales bacterium]